MSVDSNSPVDPRVQIELEKLNEATDNINKYEVELDEAKTEFRQLLVESMEKIKQSTHKLSNSIQIAKPYYEARLYSTQLSKDCQQAAINYEKAKSIHAAAKEMVYLAEQGLGEQSTLDTACQEMLSHAASRVNQSQLECTEARNILKIGELKYEVANNRVAKLQSQLKSAIKASSFNKRSNLLLINLTAYKHDMLCVPYYEVRANYNGILKAQKKRIEELESKVGDSKVTYNEALKNLERISEEIHKMREARKSSLCIGGQQSSSVDELQVPDVYERHSSEINSIDEYLNFPPKLSTKSSPIRQQKIDKLDCPHLLKDFATYSENGGGKNNDGGGSVSSSNCSTDNIHGSSIVSPNKTDITISSDDIEQWTEIRLSNSESTSSGYSQHSGGFDDRTPESSTSSSISNPKVTCTVFNIPPKENGKKKDDETLSNWISKSTLKTSGRRQSLDILIDASDRVKDAFTTGFQKVGKTLERRNSESEVNSESNDFFSFNRSETNKDGLSDEQVENLLLNDECVDLLKNVLNISKSK